MKVLPGFTDAPIRRQFELMVDEFNLTHWAPVVTATSAYAGVVLTTPGLASVANLLTAKGGGVLGNGDTLFTITLHVPYPRAVLHLHMSAVFEGTDLDMARNWGYACRLDTETAAAANAAMGTLWTAAAATQYLTLGYHRFDTVTPGTHTYTIACVAEAANPYGTGAAKAAAVRIRYGVSHYIPTEELTR